MRKATRLGTHQRQGFSFLELQVAMIVLSLGLVGLVPLVVFYSRGLESLEKRLVPAGTWYYIPSSDEWARKLGAGATLTSPDPGPAATPRSYLVDNVDTGYAESGTGWTAETDIKAYSGAYRRHEGAEGDPDTATWQFADLAPGSYEILATWPEAPDRTIEASYSVYDGTTYLGNYNVNQRNAPAGSTTFPEWQWQQLAVLQITSGTAYVKLNSVSVMSGSVAADAVRLAPVRNTVQLQSLQRSLGSEEVSAQVSITVPIP